MAQLTTIIKSILNGSKTPAPTTGEMKSALGTVYDFVTELLGTDSSNKAAARAALGVSSSSAMRNLVLNPDFRQNQRGYISGVPTTVANQYWRDRWRVPTSGQNVTWTVAGTSLIITPPASGIEQVIPAENIIGGTYAMTWGGTATGSVNGTTVAKNETFILPANTPAKIKFTGGTVERVQLEPESCGAFEARPYSLELALCEHFFQKGVHYCPTGRSKVPFRTTMRPSVTSITATGSLSLVGAGTDEFGFQVDATSGTTTTWTADSELYF